MSKPRDRLRIGDVARESGVSVKALRYYETLGLVSPSGRTEAGYRLYSDDSLDRLRFVHQAQALGLLALYRRRHDGDQFAFARAAGRLVSMSEA